jgi:DnaJ domain
MFDRSKSDNPVELGGVTVDITLTNEETIKGKMVMPVSRSAADAVNGPGQFIEICPFAGERQYIAKTSIRMLRLVPVPKAVLGEAIRDLDGFDPHRILGLGHDASWDDTRHAYLKLSKVYHPDRFATADLPPEVADYLSGMARRINAAFAALEDGRDRTVRRADRVQPIYQSPNRQGAPRA